MERVCSYDGAPTMLLPWSSYHGAPTMVLLPWSSDHAPTMDRVCSYHEEPLEHDSNEATDISTRRFLQRAASGKKKQQEEIPTGQKRAHPDTAGAPAHTLLATWVARRRMGGVCALGRSLTRPRWRINKFARPATAFQAHPWQIR
jgi:hypothetical protein